MNKLFKAGLAVLAMSLLATSVSASSPVWSTLPDVMVGGCEPGGLVFTDAFDAFDFVSDADDSTPTISIYFAEGPWDTNLARSAQQTDGTSSGVLTINGENEVNYVGPGDVNLEDQSLLTSGELTAVDGNLTIAATQDGADRAVVLIATDGITSPTVSKVFRVRSDSAECDEQSFPVTVTNIDGWDLNAEWSADWVFINLVALSGSAATGSVAGDALVSVIPAVGQNVSVWQLAGSAPKIPLATPGIIRTRWTISSTAATNAWPPVRFRVFENGNHNPASLSVSANGYVPAPSVSRTYQGFYQAPAELATDLNLGLFFIDTSDTQGGNFTLDSLVVDSIVGLDDLFSTVQVVDTGESLTLNNFIELGPATTVTGAKTADAFTYTAAVIAGPSDFTFDQAQLNNAVASMAANTLYRLEAEITSTTPRATQPAFGMRMIQAGNLISLVNRFVGTGANSDVLATSTAKTYTTFLTSEGVDGTALHIAFDVIHNNASRSGNVTLERCVISAVDLGQIP
jgi:hypothetical protein